MSFTRRGILKAGAMLSASAALPSHLWAQSSFEPQPAEWRTFEVKTTLEIAGASSGAQAWVPLPSVNEKDWFRTIGSEWSTNGSAERVREKKYGAEMLHVRWGDGEKTPAVEVKSKISVRDRAIDLGKPGNVPKLPAGQRRLYLEGTKLIPVDGIVKETSGKIVAGAGTDLEKVRAIYEWVARQHFPGCRRKRLRHRRYCGYVAERPPRRQVRRY